MSDYDVNALLQQIEASLKDFQRATVDEVYKRLFQGEQRRMLVADEVGLGKTIVARGVIARAISDRLRNGTTDPLRVTYICSNQVIAQENVRKLDLHKDGRSHDRFTSRLTFLAYEPKRDDSGELCLTTLTPGTSFSRWSHTGQSQERQILYSLLVREHHFNAHRKGIAAMLRATVQKRAREWYEQLDRERDAPGGVSLRSDCHRRFREAIRKRKIMPHSTGMFAEVGLRREISLYNAIRKLLEHINLKNLNRYREVSDFLIRHLKDCLSDVCVEYIDADLYILDEFQRFKELVDPNAGTDAAEIANRIFSKKKDVRVLLLSATPFKAFTGAGAHETGEEHYREFSRVLQFLLQQESPLLEHYELHRQALYRQLLELGRDGAEISTQHRDAVQNVLRRVICRTERLLVSNGSNAMTRDIGFTQPLQLSSGDVRGFIATDRIVQQLNRLIANSGNSLSSPVEFCKSAPFPLSFLDGYQLRKKLENVEEKHPKQLQSVLSSNPAAWISHEDINGYADLINADASNTPNAKLLNVMQQVLEGNAEQLLWVPPSLPCYLPEEDPFARAGGFSKTLVFSAWVMVPRMLSTLISYEVERRTIGNLRTQDVQEKEDRKYFQQDKEKRHPIPQLVFSQKERKTDGVDSAANMSNFTLLYPSRALANLFDPDTAIAAGHSVSQVRARLVSDVGLLIDRAGLRALESPTGESEKWYWAAPLLLDYRMAKSEWSLETWLQMVMDGTESGFLSVSRTTDSPEQQDDDAIGEADGESGQQQSQSRRLHLTELLSCIKDPEHAGLGNLPDDLPEVLADMALGSPAVASLRCSRPYRADTEPERSLFAFNMAGEFLRLFNKPEAIAAVRLSTPRSPYWRRVLHYCVHGCLQSVLDEFVHLLKTDCSDLKTLFVQITESMNLGTASIKVDDLHTFRKNASHGNNTKRRMRSHFAVDMGNQRLETDGGQKRIKGIRHNFNSPFRPFVLATTSIGQEGLDFHKYCRRIVHWNLPSNPIDLEQREGRINRFKGLVIRQQIAARYRDCLLPELCKQTDVWDLLFEIAAQKERAGTGKCELIPYWHVEADLYQIERIVPFYPFSRDREKLTQLLRTLAIYRLAFGQPRQVELVEHLQANVPEERLQEIREKLMLDLSPISYRSPETN